MEPGVPKAPGLAGVAVVAVAAVVVLVVLVVLVAGLLKQRTQTGCLGITARKRTCTWGRSAARRLTRSLLWHTK
jgi:hypothetical protein